MADLSGSFCSSVNFCTIYFPFCYSIHKVWKCIFLLKLTFIILYWFALKAIQSNSIARKDFFVSLCVFFNTFIFRHFEFLYYRLTFINTMQIFIFQSCFKILVVKYFKCKCIMYFMTKHFLFCAFYLIHCCIFLFSLLLD